MVCKPLPEIFNKGAEDNLSVESTEQFWAGAYLKHSTEGVCKLAVLYMIQEVQTENFECTEASVITIEVQQLVKVGKLLPNTRSQRKQLAS